MAKQKMSVKASMGENFTTNISGSHDFVIDQPKGAGGDDQGPNPLEVFLSSLPACFCAIGRIIANQRQLPVKGIDATVEGEIDKDYLLGKTTEGRAGFTQITTYVTIDADMDEGQKQEFLKEIEERCPIYDNMANPSTIETKLQ